VAAFVGALFVLDRPALHHLVDVSQFDHSLTFRGRKALPDGRGTQAHRGASTSLRAAGAGFFDSVFDHFTGFTGALLNPTEQFVVLALDVLEIVIGELGPSLFQLALSDVPVALDFKCVHRVSFLF
jgi:hypothetical protein